LEGLLYNYDDKKYIKTVKMEIKRKFKKEERYPEKISE